MRADVRMLGALLGRVLRESGSPGLFDDVERLRAATIQAYTDETAGGVRARRGDRRLVQHPARRRGRPGVHRLLPPHEPHRGAPAGADPPGARRAPRSGGCHRLGRRRVRASRRRGRRRHGARAPAGAAVPPRVHRAPHRGAPERDLAQHPPPDRAARRARHHAAQRRRRATGRASHDRGDRHAVAHRAAARGEALAHRRGAIDHGGLRRDPLHRGPARVPPRRRRPAGARRGLARTDRASRSSASARGSAATATATRS